MESFEQARNFFLQALAHHNRNRLDEAEALYRKAHAAMPGRVSVMVNLATVLARLNRVPEALEFCEQVLLVEPGNPDALATRAACQRETSGPTHALELLDQALRTNPGNGRAWNDKAVVLRELGRFSEALDSHERALAIKPGDAMVLTSRADTLVRLGRHRPALDSYRAALQSDPRLSPAGVGFIHLVLNAGLVPTARDTGFEALVIRAIREPWAQPVSVAPVLIHLLRSDAAFQDCLTRLSSSWPTRLPYSGPDLLRCQNAMFTNPLLIALLESAVIPDVAIERALTTLRLWLLTQAHASRPAAPQSDALPTPAQVAFHCALGLQCLNNDYVYSCQPHELAMARQVRDQLHSALDAGRPIPLPWLLTTATYFPLSSLPDSHRLLDLPWPVPVQSLLERQVCEPLLERRKRSEIPRLTEIVDPVSRQVRRQYEDNPYPRWVKQVQPNNPLSLRDYVSNRVPGAVWNDDRHMHSGEVAVLSAGCGTGQQPIDTALRLRGARILAVDLSMASLAYASRMAEVSGAGNLSFAQADILGLGVLDQRFDLIESTGVLHHLDSPGAGLAVLRRLMKPGGVMRLALYSDRARRPVAAARELIAQRGYAATAEDIRCCREEILALPDDAPAKRVSVFSDFYSTSECRDLLFHVREHRFDIPAIQRLLEAADLELIGFELKPAQRHGFAKVFPEPASLSDLHAWQAFEQQHPDTFAEMYTFWVRNSDTA